MKLQVPFVAAEPTSAQSPIATPPAQPGGSPADAHRVHGWVPIRRLSVRHRARLLEHLRALDDNSRLLRFGHVVSDEQIISYVEHIDFGRDEVFGIFDRRLRLLATAHLAFEEIKPGHPGSAEFGVSVLMRARGRGFGTRLFDHAVTHARNRGVSTMVIHVARENRTMLGIVRRAGAKLEFEGCDAIAHLPLPSDTLVSHIGQLVEDGVAELDYRLKLKIFRLGHHPPGDPPGGASEPGTRA